MKMYLTSACGGCKPKGKDKKKGFTLIELLIVITIIGILAVALLPRIIGAPARARDTARKSDLGQIAAALENYYSDNGSYPTARTGICNIGESASVLISYLSQEIKDPVSQNLITTTDTTIPNCTGGYLYLPLANNGTDAAGFLLAANVEIDANANFDENALILPATTYMAMSTAQTGMGNNSQTGAGSLYVIIH